MKKTIFILLVIIFVLGGIFFIFKNKANPIEDEQRLNFTWTKNAGPLNPHLYTPNEMYAQNMVFEPLVKYDLNGKIIPWLATSWQITDNGKTYIFQLRQDVFFSNGEKFNADAVVKNFKAIADNKNNHLWTAFRDIDFIAALDNFTVQISFENSNNTFLKELSLTRPFRFIAPSQFIDDTTKYGIKQAIGTGPWVYTESKPNQYDVFSRNEHYWGKKPLYKQIIVKIIEEVNSKLITLSTGDIDLIYGDTSDIPLGALEQLLHDHDFEIKYSNPMGTLLYYINSNKTPTNSLNVRRAINHGIDKDIIIKTVFRNHVKKADTLFDRSVPMADIPLPVYAYDHTRAISLLEQDGWRLNKKTGIREKNGNSLTIQLYYIGINPIDKTISEIIQAQLKKIGIEIILHPQESSNFYAKQKNGDFGMMLSATWGNPYEPELYLNSMREAGYADYQAQLGLADKTLIDEKITSVLLTHDEYQQRHLITEILTILHQSAIYVPIAYQNNISIIRKTKGHIPFSPLKDEIPMNLIWK